MRHAGAGAAADAGRPGAHALVARIALCGGVGEAEIALRCGVPRPARMAPTDQLQEINGVGWFADPDRPTLFTAVTDVAYVEVTIAAGHTAAGVLADLSKPVGAMSPQAG